MISKIAILALVVTLGASVPAAAQDHPGVVYQKSLLARVPLPAGDKLICDAKAGAVKVPRDACHVTRLFIADINAGRHRDDKVFPPMVFPPMTDIKYTVNQAEIEKIMNRLP